MSESQIDMNPSAPDNVENTGTDSLATPENESGETSTGFNPAWNPVLDVLPESLRPLLKEPLAEWDKNYENLQTKYKPFENVPEPYRDEDTLNQALTIWQNVQENPHGVLKLLAESLGVSLAEAKEIVEEQKQEAEKSADPDISFDDEDDPRIKKMYEEISAMKQAQQERFDQEIQRQEAAQLAEAERVEGAKIDAQINKLKAEGHFGTDPAEQELYIRDLVSRASLAIENGSKDPIGEAFKQQQAYNAAIAQRYSKTPATQQNLLFMPTNGQAPPNAPKAPDLDTEDGRRSAARAIRDQLAKG